MTIDDYRTFVTIGRRMAARNGYTPMQSSDLYVTDGDQIDWMYGRHRIFSFTWELYPTRDSARATDHYSPDEIIVRETKRNREALLYTLRVAGCPYGAIDRQQANCGAFFDDFEGSKGWTRDPDGTDNAVGGRWQIGNPAPTALASMPPSSRRDALQLDLTTSGSRALVTGAAAGASAAANDLDGTTTIRSAPSWFRRSPPRAPRGPSHSATTWRTRPTPRPTTGSAPGWRRPTARARSCSRSSAPPTTDAAAWASARIAMDPWAGQTVRIVLGAADGEADSLVEAAVDDVRIERP